MPAKFSQADPKVVNKWAGRIVPPVLMGVVGYATYVLVVRLCINYLLNGDERRPGPAIVLLVIYFLLLIFMATTYFRLLYAVTFDTAYVSRSPVPKKRVKNRAANQHRSTSSNGTFIGREYSSSDTMAPNNNDVDSPGLEQFYTKNVFVCEGDGKPRWCTECKNWKPDRVHHSSDVGRCVRKMDHFCPWVGGMVAENSFKFFLQFVTYTWLYCLFLLVPMAIYLREQIITPNQTFDPQFVAIIALAAFFGIFTFSMTVTAGKDALANSTTVDNLNKTRSWRLAVFLPKYGNSEGESTGAVSGHSYGTITYPLSLSSTPALTVPPTAASLDNSACQNSQLDGTLGSSETLSERDSKATRTFAILSLTAGQSPWDLGPMLNWKSVMGDNMKDWFLPIKHSPCRNHENGESDYKLGQWFELLKVENSLMLASEVRMPRPFVGHNKAATKAVQSLELLNVVPRSNQN